MSSLNEENISRVKNKGVIQYASDQMNDPTLDDKDTMEGIKRIALIDRTTREAILMHEAEKDKIISTNNGKMPVVTGTEIEEDVQKGSYREMLDR